MTGRVLIVEDDRKIVATVSLYLEHNGFEVQAAHTGPEALERFRKEEPDILILDLMLPGMSGFDLCRKLRAESAVPIIMLTARASEEDKLRGLGLGADDYITKPFSPREVVARVRAVLRRRTVEVRERGSEPLSLGDLSINIERHEVWLRGEVVRVTRNEFRLLEALMKSPGRAFSRQELVERAFGWDFDGLERTVDAHIMNLRRKLRRGGPNAHTFITTVHGVGYKLSDETQST